MATVTITEARAVCKCMVCKHRIARGEWYVKRDSGPPFNPDRFCAACALKWPDDAVQAAAQTLHTRS